ncbi:MAG TPA: CPBP family intramembrane metalloprotease [Candidatus Nocardiopsis merdipullorum]|nr:CPBP family intramembrane metalloprotease [Candidatus Nocardiopsis merdipullorum]
MRLRHTALVGAFTVATIGLVLAVARIGMSLAPSHWPDMFWLVSVVGALRLITPLVGCVAGHLVLMCRGPRLRDLGLTWPNRFPVGLLLWVLLAIVTSALATGATLGLVNTFGGSAPADGPALSATLGLVAELPPGAALTITTGTVIVFPLCEEIICRDMLHGALSRHVAPWATVVLSALLFSALHATPLVTPYVFVLGLWSTWLPRKYESILPAVVLHCCNNALVAGLALSAL